MHTLAITSTQVGKSLDGTAANALVFMRAWRQVLHDVRYRAHDWVVKVDPDAVLIPGRLRKHLAPFNGQSVFVRNCGKYTGEGWPMMYGSVEAVSKSAVVVYAGGWKRCREELNWTHWGEDVYMAQCLSQLGVDPIDDMDLVGDERCEGADCKSEKSAAFHPFKDTVSWWRCYQEAAF